MEKKPTDRIIENDGDLCFPNAVLLKASAGSGKTHNLSLRFVQFLLSEKIGNNELSNILAITFTKNAAREMKARILKWLKDCYFGNEKEAAQVLEVTSMGPAELPGRSEKILDNILTRYTDFQVQTIDSFMASIFKASTQDLGFPPFFEIVLDNSDLIEYAFNRYLRKVRPDSIDGGTFERIARLIQDSQGANAAFPWDPTGVILDKLKTLYARLAAQKGRPDAEDSDKARMEIEKKIARQTGELEALIEQSGLERSARSGFYKVSAAVKENRYPDLVEVSLKTPPVKKPNKSHSGAEYDRILDSWLALAGPVRDYCLIHARSYFRPYLMAYESFDETLEKIKRREQTVFIEDINKRLARYIDEMIIPDIYFHLGDRIFHYLVDEFQDTSPIQWTDMRPLIENSLSVAGSFFVVGDTKQAIFGFRDADYRIMKELEERASEYFGSVEIDVRELGKNYRSCEKILEFARRIFPGKLDELDQYSRINRGPAGAGAGENGAENAGRGEPLYAFQQEVIEENRGKGFVEVAILEKTVADGAATRGSPGDIAEAEEPWEGEAEGDVPEKAEVQKRVRELHARGYRYADIAVLTYKNESVVNAASWLNEIDVPFVPYSSLDIRTRKITGELMALLRFLDSPPDDLSFSKFLLGDVLAEKMRRDGLAVPRDRWGDFLFDCRLNRTRPVYVAFRALHPGLWERYFAQSFKSVGYYPLYDLVTLIYRVFSVFESFPGEESALAKFMESVKDFESVGRNDLREFLNSAEQGAKGGRVGGRSGGARATAAGGPDAAWNIDVPIDIDAVKIMTIHKAKGLGFPAVILLLYEERFKPPDFYIDAGEADTAEIPPVRVYKISQKLAETHADLGRIYGDFRLGDDVNKLNTLYVALTRAEEELHVIGVKSGSAKLKYPFDLIETCRLGEPRPRTFKSGLPRLPEAGLLRLAEPSDISAPPRAALNSENIRRGILAHEILAGLEYVSGGRGGWDAAIAGVIRKIRPSEFERTFYENVGRAVAAYFGGPGSPLEDYFGEREGRRILREFNFCDTAGNVYRMDRVVLDPDEVTVIDFKTGFVSGKERLERRDAEDRRQMRDYLNIVGEIYPGRRLRGILARIDEKRAETVES